eukprot:159879-Rhodomonas_salina.1
MDELPRKKTPPCCPAQGLGHADCHWHRKRKIKIPLNRFKTVAELTNLKSRNHTEAYVFLSPFSTNSTKHRACREKQNSRQSGLGFHPGKAAPRGTR